MYHNWTAITESWRAPNGMIVSPVSTNERLRQIGETLRNGLTEDWARNKWSGLCVAGRRQILEIADMNGNLVAVAMLRANKTKGPDEGAESHRAQIEALFVRGGNNALFGEGHPAFEAVSLFVEALNTPSGGGLSFIGRIEENGFAANIRDTRETTALGSDTTLKAKDGHYKSLEEMLRDIGLALREPSPTLSEATPTSDGLNSSWAPLSRNYSGANGWTIEPIGDAKGMRLLGEEIENLLFNDDILTPIIATCARGLARYVAIKDTHGVIRGYAQFGFSGGCPNFIVARGYCDQRLPDQAVEALNEYWRGIRTERIPLTVSIGISGFMTPTEAPDLGTPDLGSVMAEVPEAIALPIPTVQPIDPREELLQAAAHDQSGFKDESWEVPAAAWEDPGTGFRVVIAEKMSDIVELAPHFPGNLSAKAALEHFSRASKAGHNFILSVHNREEPQAYGVLTLDDNGVAHLTYLYGRGRNETEALCNRPKEAIIAAEQWIEAYNSGALTPKGMRI